MWAPRQGRFRRAIERGELCYPSRVAASDRDASRGGLSSAGPPHGIDLFAYAAISADIAEGDRPLAEILRERGLTDEQWMEGTLFWSRRMSEDARPDPSGKVEPRVALTFSDAFARAQDQKRPLVVLTVAQWAELVHEIEAYGVGPVLARRGLRMADHSRLVRHWAKALGTTPSLVREYEAARAALDNADQGV